jgi:hypothetical protein
LAASFKECTNVEQRSVIRFLWSERVNLRKNDNNDKRMSQGKVNEYVERVNGRRKSIGNVQSGCPSTVTCVEVKEHIDKCARDNR